MGNNIKEKKGFKEFCRKFRNIKGKTIIGLTGALGSGKSAALGFFRDCGAFCVSTDALAKEVLTSGACYNRILTRFGPRVFLKDGSIARNKLAEEVFSDTAKRKRLENILHPEILKKTLSLIKKSHEKIIVVEVPLLFETGLEGCFDLTICVDASGDLRMRRAVRKGWNPGEMKARSAAQLPAGEKAARADIVAANDGSLKDLRNKIRRIYDFLNAAKLGNWRKNERR
ncbi:MAG: dephospho-CoA kinase [Elusimicrobia bacterium]|nr:dephospho-CoA kinase [Elusimicrobiota bacterium]